MMSKPPPVLPRWQITDEALAILDRELAAPAPERGAALLAAVDSRLVVDVVVDPVAGETSSYWHSPRLGVELNERLVSSPLLRYVGTSHSHPAGMAWPSAPDHVAFEASVRAAGLDAGLFPIVVQASPDELSMPEVHGHEHLAPLAHGTLAPYTWRTGQGLDACRVSVLPLRQPLETAIATLADRVALTAGPTQVVAGVGTTWLLVPLTGDVAIDLLVPQSFPQSAPLVRVDGDAFVSPRWDLSEPLMERWQGTLLDLAPGTSAAEARAGIEARIGLHVPPAAERSQQRVAVLGCGSVGSTMAELLVRSGVQALTLVDPDLVGRENLSRSTYTVEDLGASKVGALAARLTAIAPDLDIRTVPTPLGSAATEVLADVDLAVMATDDPSAEAWHSHVLYWLGIPYVSAKLFARAEAGEITAVVPTNGTACLACATGMTTDAGRRGTTDYGAGRLDGELALGPDVMAVSARAARVALALLHRDRPGPLADWVAPLLADHRTLNLSCTVAGWGVFEQVARPPLDGPFASLWVRTEPHPSCAVCGDFRLDPERPLDELVVPDDLDALIADLEDETVAAPVPAGRGGERLTPQNSTIDPDTER